MHRFFTALLLAATLHAAELEPIAVQRETELRHELGSVSIDGGIAVPGRVGPNVLFSTLKIPPDYVGLPDANEAKAFYIDVYCPGTWTATIAVEWAHYRFAKGASISGEPLKSKQEKIQLECMEGRKAQADLTPIMHKSLEGGLDSFDIVAYPPEGGYFVQWKTVGMNYEARTNVGPQGDPGIQGLPGRDGKDGSHGRDGIDGKPGVAGKNGRDGKPGVCPICNHKPPCKEGDKHCGD